jgi:hypothetical protein
MLFFPFYLLSKREKEESEGHENFFLLASALFSSYLTGALEPVLSL